MPLIFISAKTVSIKYIFIIEINTLQIILIDE
jgi:hypothetical protein